MSLIDYIAKVHSDTKLQLALISQIVVAFCEKPTFRFSLVTSGVDPQ